VTELGRNTTVGMRSRRRYPARALVGLSTVMVVMVATAGVSGAKATHTTKPKMKSAVSSPSVPLGSSDTDTVTLTGTAKKGSPTGTVTFSVCGPTTSATPCTSANGSSATVGLSAGAHHRSTVDVTVSPGSSGWYCFLDQYTGDSHYKPASDNNVSTECFDVTGGGTTNIPTLTTAVSSTSVSLGTTVTDTATVTGNSGAGSPTGTVTFSACGPTATATACTSPSGTSATVALSPESNNQSVATAGIDPGATGWYCFFDQYSGDAHYTSVTDDDTSTECFDVTSTTAPSTPTLTTGVSSASVSLGTTVTDTATVTGNSGAGSPTGTVTFSACGPTATATACTSQNGGSATVALSPESNNQSVATAAIDPGATGWYCFFAQYSGDAHYTSVTDDSTSTECFDVSGGTGPPSTPTLRTALSSPSIPSSGSASDVATVTGNSSDGSPTGTVSFYICGPTTGAAPCTSPNIGPVAAQLGEESGNRSVASVTVYPGAPGWYCFLAQYNGDSHYTTVTDNDSTTECLDVTGSTTTAPGRDTTSLVMATP
jgi:hypothetical protein